MPLREYITHNFWLKLFSLFLAMLIWFSVRFYAKQDTRLSRNPLSLFSTREFVRVPVRVIVPPDAGTFKVEPAYVDVTVNGEKSLLNEMPSRDILAFVNLHDGTALRTSSHKVQVYVPPGTTVGKVVPPVVRVEHSALENH